ncbi:MAG TPA: alpha/beta hydrolase [Xanthobacteraceae bacterium]|nr:alpha/beta hydrolase [Xanthobacteraceae bacterium]
MGPDPVTSTFITAQDGLRLHVRAWGPRLAALLPVVCLPGLARTIADFETLASALASGANGPRSVLALDLRGRGRSDYDRNPKNYNVQVELADVLAVLTALAVDQAVFIGTSRGGILTMLLAVARPTALAGCVLNDVGPVIETKGLMRIKSYVGKLPQVASLHEAADVLRRLLAAQFPKLSDDDWVTFARRTFKDDGGRIVPDYDVRLGKTLAQIDPTRPVPALWKEFNALARVPLLVIRGGNSDILSRATVAAMQTRHPAMEAVEVADQGHAPLLSDPALIARIAAFAESCDARR